MSKIQDDVFQILHDHKVDVFGFVEDEPNKKIGLALPFDLDPEFQTDLEKVLPDGWKLVFQKSEIPEAAKGTEKGQKALEQKLIRMPNREERRRFEKGRK